MAKKKVTKKINSDKSKLEAFSTPVTKRNLNTTYIKSATRPLFPDNILSRKNAVFNKKSNLLKELGLTDNLWETYRVNALYDFKYQQPMLRHYEKKLKTVLDADITKIGLNSQFNNVKFEVEMQYFYNMAFSKNDYPPLKIVIYKEDEEVKIYFTGIMLSVERKKGFMEDHRRSAGATLLPLFLVSYTDRIFFESVKYFLEDTFSCLVSPLKFTKYDMLWMLALFSPKYDYCINVSKIEYLCPFEELKKLHMSIDPYTIVEVWNGILDLTVDQTICEEQVYQFIQNLELHFFKTFRINLSELTLLCIKTPFATITADHTALIHDTTKVYCVIRHLTHLAQETIKTSH